MDHYLGDALHHAQWGDPLITTALIIALVLVTLVIEYAFDAPKG